MAAEQQHAQQQQQQEEQQSVVAAAGDAVLPNLKMYRQGGTLVAAVAGLPPMIDVTAGFSHLAFTDGASVWTIGKQVSQAGGTGTGDTGGSTASAADASWLQPTRVLHMPEVGVSSLAGGAFATAAISGAGQLWLWGTLLNEGAAAALGKRAGAWGRGRVGCGCCLCSEPLLQLGVLISHALPRRYPHSLCCFPLLLSCRCRGGRAGPLCL
jgi:hypothetical protein